LNGIQEVVGSIPSGSTKLNTKNQGLSWKQLSPWSFHVSNRSPMGRNCFLKHPCPDFSETWY
jgi:hypothetical protein